MNTETRVVQISELEARASGSQNAPSRPAITAFIALNGQAFFPLEGSELELSRVGPLSGVVSEAVKQIGQSHSHRIYEVEGAVQKKKTGLEMKTLSLEIMNPSLNVPSGGVQCGAV